MIVNVIKPDHGTVLDSAGMFVQIRQYLLHELLGQCDFVMAKPPFNFDGVQLN